MNDGLQLESDVESDLLSSNMDAAQNAINDFGAKYRDVVCKVEYEGQSEMINVNDFISRANASLAQYREQHRSESTSIQSFNPSADQTTSKPAPAWHEKASEAFKNGITLQVHNKATFNPAHERGIGSMIIQNGNLVSSFEVDRSSDYCTIMYLQQDTEVEAESSLRLNLADANSLRVEFYPTNFSFTLTCQKAEGSSNDISIEDLNRILGRLATASINQ